MFRAKKLYKNQYLQFKYFDATNEFEQFCLEHLDYIRSIDIPDICCDEDYVDDENKLTITSNSIITNKIKQTIHVLEKKGEYTPNILKEISKINAYSQDDEPKIEIIDDVYPYDNNYNENIKQTVNDDIKEDLTSKYKKQAILVYFECSHHIEFVIRNVIIKLGNGWHHSILCGVNNYDFMKQIATSICNKISIIQMENCENMEQHKKLMKTIDYWQMFNANKILHYTSTTTIFKKNIEEFMDYDYISASSFHELGTGSLSLRTRKTMIDILTNFVNNDDEQEDLFFSKIMIEHGIGKIADKHTSSMFSTEVVNSTESIGGHNYWSMNLKWKDRLYSNVIIQFKPLHNVNELQFRGGWKSVLYKLIELKFFSDNANKSFLDILEQHFSPVKEKTLTDKWTGIIHLTPNGPPYLYAENIANLFCNNYFLQSLENCPTLFTLSLYVTNYLQKEFEKIEKPINIITLKHPVVQNDIIPFSFEKFKENTDKKLIQIGQQYRKMTSIYIVNVPDNYKKMWLTGNKDFRRINNTIKMEKKYLNIQISFQMEQSVVKYYTETYEEYDEYLSKNIVFIDLFDAAANNTVLECIVRKTPIIVNKIPGVVDYLGENYPLYFSNLDEVTNLLHEEKLLEAHEYLKTIDTTSLEIDYFLRKLLTHIQDVF